MLAALLKAQLLNDAPIERVATFKLLWVHVASDLKWTVDESRLLTANCKD